MPKGALMRSEAAMTQIPTPAQALTDRDRGLADKVLDNWGNWRGLAGSGGLCDAVAGAIVAAREEGRRESRMKIAEILSSGRVHSHTFPASIVALDGSPSSARSRGERSRMKPRPPVSCVFCRKAFEGPQALASHQRHCQCKPRIRIKCLTRR